MVDSTTPYTEIINTIVLGLDDDQATLRDQKIISAMKIAFESKVGVGSSNTLPADTFESMLAAVNNYNIEAWTKINPVT